MSMISNNLTIIFFFFFLLIATLIDLCTRKIPNYFFFFAILTKIIIIVFFEDEYDFSIMFAIIEFFYFIFFFTLWKEHYIGGADLKLIYLYLFYFPVNFSYSKFQINNSIIQDRFQFFFSLLILLSFFKVYKNLIEKKRKMTFGKIIPIYPFFFISWILSILI